jgi:methyltransferase (TIGR00027 family)
VIRGRPSLTAERVALSRAAHQLLDAPRVLEDPLALRISGAHDADILARRTAFAAAPARHLRAFLVARSRLAEEALAQAIGRGVRQYVVLGAGLDTFACRNPYPAALLRVFEVDHPATQAWKRERLLAAGIEEPASLTFVPIDFETQNLAARLCEAGFRAGEPAFVSWLGVTMYLSRAAVLETLSYAAGLAAGSAIVFDYALPPASLGPGRRALYRMRLTRVAAAGEPWRTFFEPEALAALLSGLGFASIQDSGAAELNARFFAQRTDGLAVAGPGRVLHAVVDRSNGPQKGAADAPRPAALLRPASV